MNNNRRDQVVDLFKGFTILWIIHIHTVFWSGRAYLPNYVRELSLIIDVPIFFFLSGYLVFVGSFRKIFQRSLRQFKRLYLTYTTFTIVVFFVSFSLRYLFDRSLPPIDKTFLDILMVTVDFPELRGFAWNLWFLRTYLCLILIVPLFAIFHQSLHRNIILFSISLIIFFLVSNEGQSNLPVYIIFYSVFFFIGSIFRTIENRIQFQHFFISLFFVILCVSLAIHMDDYKIILQNNKFPPSLSYLCYSLIYLHLFVYLKCFYSQSLMKIPFFIRNFLIWSSREVFNIYLVQSVVCSLPFLFIDKIKGGVPSFFLYLFILTFNLLLTILIVWLYRQFTITFYRLKNN